METLIPLFEGFLTYGGISVREIEAMAVGLYETQDETIIRQSPDSIAFLVNDLQQKGIPIVTPAGVLGCHVDAMSFARPPSIGIPCRSFSRGLFTSFRVFGEWKEARFPA